MICVDCGKSIADRLHPGRGGRAYLCLDCARERQLAYARRRSFEAYRDPVIAPKMRAYQSAYNRARRARRVLEVIKCEGCGQAFQMNRTGRRRLVCIPCTSMHEGYLDVRKFMAAARRRSIRDRERRQRRAA